MKRITVLLAEDHTFVREAVRKLLELEDDFKVVGEAQDGRQAVALAQKLHPNVVLMDIAMPLLNGLEATRHVLKASPGTKVLILSAHGDDAYVKSAAEAGAAGYLLKQTSADEVCQAIREAQNGKKVFNSSVAGHLHRPRIQPFNQSGWLGKEKVQLTSREMEVLQLIAEGKANKETAAELSIGLKTVEKHREHIMQKLNIHDTAGLTRYAIAKGIIESSAPSNVV